MVTYSQQLWRQSIALTHPRRAWVVVPQPGRRCGTRQAVAAGDEAVQERLRCQRGLGSGSLNPLPRAGPAHSCLCSLHLRTSNDDVPAPFNIQVRSADLMSQRQPYFATVHDQETNKENIS